MRKRYPAILTGIILIFIMISGCGMNRNIQQSDEGRTQREEELQAEIDALRQEIDELKSGQQTESSGDGQSADDVQTSDGGQNSDNRTSQSDGSGNNAYSSSENSGGVSGVSITLEEAQNIALERVPGATAQNISIELDEDDGWYIYEGDILYNRMEYEFEIDANTGNILKWETEKW